MQTACMRALLGFAAGSLCTALTSSDAAAQTAWPVAPMASPSGSVGASLGPPQVFWLGRAGDTSGPGGSSSRGALVIEPLRLGLLAFAPPVGANIPGCADSAEAAGTSTGAVTGFATQRAVAFELVPRLTLFGFSRLGCPVDAVVGGGIVYAVPISRTVSFSLSAGALYRPHSVGVPAPEPSLVRGADVKRDVRADIAIARGGGRTLNIGVGLLSKAISFGGLW